MTHASSMDQEHASMRIMLLGNCQVTGLGRSMQTMLDGAEVRWHLVHAAWLRQLEQGEWDDELATSDLIFVHPHPQIDALFDSRFRHLRDRVRPMPVLVFAAFHPDMDYIFGPQGTVKGPMGEYHSALVFHAWRQGWTPRQAHDLFNETVYRALGYLGQWRDSVAWLQREGERCGLSLDGFIDRWSRRGPWMHSLNHPRIWVLADVARELLGREGLSVHLDQVDLLPDSLAEGPVWPIYPGIGRQFAQAGHLRFKKAQAWTASAERTGGGRWIRRGSTKPNAPQPLLPWLGLQAFIDASYRAYAAFKPELLRCDRLDAPPWNALNLLDLAEGHAQAANAQAMSAQPLPAGESSLRAHPYASLADSHFWRRAVLRPPAHEVDPVTPMPRRSGPQDRVATAGSCFAQHIAQTLQRSGLRYFVTEPGSALPDDEARRQQYGVYSARYGNVYTARQMRQLFERAYGLFVPGEAPWQRDDGRWVDPFRPQVQADGFDSREAMEADRTVHLAAVRELFETLDVFVFTFGLTEAWYGRADGAVFPMAPGVAGGRLDLSRHAFANFTVQEVVADFRAFLAHLWRVNPSARVVLTVSPVAMMATYERRHVLVSNTHTKSVLCAATHEICAREPGCTYFPGYEMVMGAHAQGRFVADDLRTIRPEGVAHVMSAFMRHCTTLGGGETESPVLLPARAAFAVAQDVDASLQQRYSQWQDIVCDEESLDVPAASRTVD